MAPLREALATKVRERNGYTVSPQQVIVTQGGVEALYASLLDARRAPATRFSSPTPPGRTSCSWPACRTSPR